jgi:glucose/arabinose dehydrogenase
VFANNEYKDGNQHFGSRIAWLPDGTMLIAIGDGGNPPLRFGDGLQREQAQEPTTLFGNVVRINPDGSVPEDNPFLDRQGYRPELYSIGNRNIQGLAYDAASGRVWATEHGSRGGDEVNIIAAGANYGWPLVSHSREYVRGTPVSRFQTLEGYADPQLVWLDTVAPSGLAVDGDTLYAGGLRSQSVHVISVDEGGEFVGESVIPIGQRVRDVRIGPDGRLWVLTDDAENGRLLRMDRP